MTPSATCALVRVPLLRSSVATRSTLISMPLRTAPAAGLRAAAVEKDAVRINTDRIVPDIDATLFAARHRRSQFWLLAPDNLVHNRVQLTGAVRGSAFSRWCAARAVLASCRSWTRARFTS
eukprot:scaffold14061_cov118-Isochrysis_galbana.AAC.4